MSLQIAHIYQNSSAPGVDSAYGYSPGKRTLRVSFLGADAPAQRVAASKSVWLSFLYLRTAYNQEIYYIHKLSLQKRFCTQISPPGWLRYLYALYLCLKCLFQRTVPERLVSLRQNYLLAQQLVPAPFVPPPRPALAIPAGLRTLVAKQAPILDFDAMLDCALRVQKVGKSILLPGGPHQPRPFFVSPVRTVILLSDPKDVPLGTGGFKTVYLAVSVLHKRSPPKIEPAAASFCKISALGEEEQTQQLNEEQFLKTFRGKPGVLQMLASSIGKEALFLLLEYCDGGDLFNFLTRRSLRQRIGEEGLLQIAQDIAEGLAFIHEEEIVHCDLKPENIFLKRDEAGALRAKIGDFGLALVDGTQTAHTPILGTPLWMSPEKSLAALRPHLFPDQRTLKRSVLSKASDIWALGAIYFTLFSGGAFLREFSSAARFTHKPFPEKWKAFQRISAIKQESLERQIDEFVPENRRDLVRLVLRKNPEERPTAAQVLEKVRTLWMCTP